MVIHALADAVLEGDETFTVQLLSARNEAVIDPTRSECLDYYLAFSLVSQHNYFWHNLEIFLELMNECFHDTITKIMQMVFGPRMIY